MNSGHILNKMGGTLNNIKRLISEFVNSNKTYDSFHINELLKCKIPKKDWIDKAWLCHSYFSSLSNIYNIHVILIFH